MSDVESGASRVAHDGCVAGGLASVQTRSLELVFWQQIVSIHQAPLVASLANMPGVRVTYVAEERMSADRLALGWTGPSLGNAELRIARQGSEVAELVASFSTAAIHITQGIRDNGMVGLAQRLLRKKGARVLVMSETVNDQGLVGIAKRTRYSVALRLAASWVDSILAIGSSTTFWNARRGFPRDRIFPFSYFLEPSHRAPMGEDALTDRAHFRVAFVGQLIPRKRLDILLSALASISADQDFELSIFGRGPEESKLRAIANSMPGLQVTWRGVVENSSIARELSLHDCLVLPSWHDGWGAVVSEALMVGTPAICSDKCGVSEALLQSRSGAVFRSGDQKSLAQCLMGVRARQLGRSQERRGLANWACGTLGSDAGAKYLVDILTHRFQRGPRPMPPWSSARF